MAVDTDFERQGQASKADSLVSDAEQLAQLDTVVNEPIRGHFITDLYGVKHTLVVETFSTYKTKEVLKLLAATGDKVDLVKLFGDIQMLTTNAPTVKINDDGTVGEFTLEEQQTINAFKAAKVNTAMETLPQVVKIAPDLALDFGALAILSNKELRNAYNGDNESIADLRDEKRRWLEFEFDASVPLKLLVMYLPYIGVNLIMQELSKLDSTVMSALQAAK